jgi:hypothetical protein
MAGEGCPPQIARLGVVVHWHEGEALIRELGKFDVANVRASMVLRVPHVARLIVVMFTALISLMRSTLLAQHLAVFVHPPCFTVDI